MKMSTTVCEGVLDPNWKDDSPPVDSFPYYLDGIPPYRRAIKPIMNSKF